MPKIELTISPDYQKNWGLWEGVRELIANALDAETEYNAKCALTWEDDVVFITNEETLLPKEVLLLGKSSKMDRNDTIGHFGEGLKIGVLALLRLGIKIVIRNGCEIWTPTIERSEKFNSEVLIFNIQAGRKALNRVSIELHGINKTSFELIRARFLQFRDVNTRETLSTGFGDILLNPSFKGHIFNHGVWVKFTPEFTYGYNIINATMNRDRSIIDNVEWLTAKMWLAALDKDSGTYDRFVALLEDQSSKECNTYLTVLSFPNAFMDFYAKRFTDRYGVRAVPVISTEEGREVEHWGHTGIVVNEQQFRLLATRIPTFVTVKEKFANSPKTVYSFSDLSEQEQKNFGAAYDTLAMAVHPDNKALGVPILIADFNIAHLEGLWKDGTIYLARSLMGSYIKTLMVLIHEYCHHIAGSDGEKSHVHAIEEMWAKIYDRSVKQA